MTAQLGWSELFVGIIIVPLIGNAAEHFSALLFAGKPISAIFNLVLYVLSIVFWITIILHTVGFIFWAIGMLHAILVINNAREERRARRIIQASRPD